ncbi:MAG: hypothetical protein JXR94_05170, partial [Candidatus Hydrogenedentes bacterium]|nr:hypothetical protein [Candidatus Hydrogenedentota bacterium]
MREESPGHALADTLCTALQYSAAFVCLETCLAAEPDTLIAYPAHAVTAPFVGFAAYGVAFFALTGMGTHLMARRSGTRRPVHALAAGAAAALLVWTALVCYAEELPFRVTASGYATIGALAALSL